MLSGVVLVGMYIVMLIRNSLGVKYRWVLLVVMLLLVSNCSTMYLAYNNWRLVIKQEQKMIFVVLLGLV